MDRAEITAITLHPATTAQDHGQMAALCRAYRDVILGIDDISAEVTDVFHPPAKFEALIARLPQMHARPHGVILLARTADGTAVGCGMSHRLDAQTCELKRIFVQPAMRGRGVAAQLCRALIAQARADGHTRVVLDTHRALVAAQKLYRALGFMPRGPYQDVPDTVLDELRFFEMPLV